jgi:hypothetical protein
MLNFYDYEPRRSKSEEKLIRMADKFYAIWMCHWEADRELAAIALLGDVVRYSRRLKHDKPRRLAANIRERVLWLIESENYIV